MDLEKIRNELQYLSTLENREYINYKKQIQLTKIPKRIKVNTRRVKYLIWNNGKNKVEPYLLLVNTPETRMDWDVLRHYTMSSIWYPPPNKMLRYLVIDKITNTYIGIISLNSPFSALPDLDKFIGWDSKNRVQNREKIMIGSSIVPTQPFGYNCAGGKLLTLLLGLQQIRNDYKTKYNQDLLGIYTTSLFGSYSQYSRLKHWKHCGKTQGKWIPEPVGEVWDNIMQIIKERHPEEIIKYTKNRRKYDLITFFCRKYNIKIEPRFDQRGVYYCPFYKNTNNILRGEETQPNEPLFQPTPEYLIELWKNKYLVKREGKESTETLFLYEEEQEENNLLNTFFKK